VKFKFNRLVKTLYLQVE